MAKKKVLRVITLVFVVVLSTASFASCSKKNEVNENAKVITTQVLNSFSSERDLYQVLLLDGYGKMTLNKEQEYYSTGEGSAKLWISNNNGASMVFKQRLKSKTYEYDYTDFKKVKSISTSIFNAAEEDVHIMFALEFSDGGKSSIKKYTLKNGWNELKYNVDREILSMQFDIEKTMYLTYTFANNEKPYTVYVDQISLGLTNSGISEVEQTIKENEICSFDSNYQMAVFSLYHYDTSVMGNFLDFGLTANPDRIKSGMAFYVTIKSGMTENKNSYMLKLNPKYGELINWDSLTENDYISFWIYNDGLADSIQFRIVNTKGKPLMDTKSEKGYTNKTNITLKANSWTEARINISDIKALADEKGYLEEGDKIGSIIESFDLLWGTFDGEPQKTFYFDEFKIVKGGD